MGVFFYLCAVFFSPGSSAAKVSAEEWFGAKDPMGFGWRHGHSLQVQVDLDPANTLPVVYRRPARFIFHGLDGAANGKVMFAL